MAYVVASWLAAFRRKGWQEKGPEGLKDLKGPPEEIWHGRATWMPEKA